MAVTHDTNVVFRIDGGSSRLEHVENEPTRGHTPGNFALDPTGVEFAGTGPTVSGEASRRFGCSGLSLFGRARSALLFGDVDWTTAF